MSGNTQTQKRKRRVFIKPYKMGSKSAKLLSQATGIKRITGKHKVNHNNYYLEWGTPLDKKEQFNCFHIHEVPTVLYTVAKKTAFNWYTQGQMVVARELLNSHSGKGITLVSQEIDDSLTLETFPDAPLYTLYLKKSAEFRVHIFKSKFVCAQQKKLKADHEAHRIRSNANGYVFCHLDSPETPLLTVAKQAYYAVGAPDVAAVDVIYNNHYDKYAVLEVNTAPGIEGTTLDKYVEAVKVWQDSLDMNPVAVVGRPTRKGSTKTKAAIASLAESVAAQKYHPSGPNWFTINP